MRYGDPWQYWREAERFNREAGEYDIPLRAQPKQRSHGATRLKTRRWQDTVAEGVTEDAPEIIPAGRLGIDILFLSTNPIGDLSNCIKTLEDALNRRAWGDDKQIDYIKALRVYEPGLDSRILLRVNERDET